MAPTATTQKTATLTSAQKTSASCYNMFHKWQEKTQPEAGKNSVGHYVMACIKGYPNKTKMKPSLLTARIRGIVNHCKDNKIPLKQEDIQKAQELVANYRNSTKPAKEPKEAKTTKETAPSDLAAKPANKSKVTPPTK